MTYNLRFYEELSKSIYEKAEQLSNQVDEDGETGVEFQLEVNNEILINFTVDISVSNYVKEIETNSVSFNTEVFCTKVEIENPSIEDEEITDYLNRNIYLETIYKD